jgi:hypothetical protein
MVAGVSKKISRPDDQSAIQITPDSRNPGLLAHPRFMNL